MIELEKVRREIATTEAGILRCWRQLDCFDLTVEGRAAKIAMIEADTRLIAVLLARLDELRRSAGSKASHTAGAAGSARAFALPASHARRYRALTLPNP